jgi:signal transduction histidine kinase/DNA-binding response OmpR family regulator/ABC-type amino acid transport substrate-binding protein
MKTIRIAAMVFIICFVAVGFSACFGNRTPLEQPWEVNPFVSFRDIPGITQQEIADIEALQREHESFTYGMIMSTESFVKDNGEIGGYAALFCEWLTGLFGIPFTVEVLPTNVLTQRLDSHDIDFSGNIAPSPERRIRYFMTNIIANRHFMIYRITESRNLEQISAERPIRFAFTINAPAEALVAAVTQPGYYEPVWVANFDEAYQVLKTGEADAYIASSIADAFFVRYGDVVAEDFFPLIFNPVSMTTANPALQSIISVVTKAIENGAADYINYLHNLGYKEYLSFKLQQQITEEERAYITRTEVVQIAACSVSYPFSFYDERGSGWDGIFFDLLENITEITGIAFDVVNDKSAQWPLMDELLTGGGAAFAPFIGKTGEQEDRFLWSQAVLYMDNYALVSTENHRDITLNDIANKKIGLTLNTPHTERFFQWFPNHTDYVMYETQERAFEGLMRGEVQLVMSTRHGVLYMTHYREHSGYKINFIFNQYSESRIGFNKDEAVLLSIIDKALHLIDTERIVGHWLNRTYDHRAKIAEARMPLMIGISVLSVLMVIFVLLFLIKANKATDVKNDSLRALENILNSIDAAIYTTVPDTGEILFMNTWLKNAFNVKGNDATGQYCYKILRNRDTMCEFCPCYQLKKEPDKVIVWEEQIPELGGVHVRHFDCLIDWPDGRKVHLQHAIDITALVNATDEAKAANRAKSVFLANINHEIRTPLNAITGMTSIGKSAADTKQKDYCFEKIEQASGFLLGVINSILDMSKIESGRFDLSLSAFHFEKMLYRVVNIINMQIQKKQIKFNVFIDTNIPDILIGDEQRLAQVITNLLSNAVKFTPQEGSIRIDTYLLGEEDGICTVQVTVTDSGIGIDKEHHSNLFRPFWQSESNLSRQFEGTGLGLTITKNIVNKMGGEIRVESEIGKGAAFTFTVKVKRGEAETHNLSERSLLNDVRVLVVDNEQETLDFLIKITDGLGIKCCDTVLNGEAALELVKQGNTYDICFIDRQLPGINGIELARILKTEYLKNTVVVLFSADAVNTANDNGTYIDKYLSKPLFPFTIIETISDCLGMADVNKNIKQKPLPQFAQRRILLAEDVEINREIFIALLEPTLLQIDCAKNGKEAVAMFNESPEKYDMIFMDLQMPQMNGYEATQNIRALDFDKAKTIPIVAMTANTFQEDVDKCLEVGMNGHIGKPLDYDKLLEQISVYL